MIRMRARTLELGNQGMCHVCFDELWALTLWVAGLSLFGVG